MLREYDGMKENSIKLKLLKLIKTFDILIKQYYRIAWSLIKKVKL